MAVDGIYSIWHSYLTQLAYTIACTNVMRRDKTKNKTKKQKQRTKILNYSPTHAQYSSNSSIRPSPRQ